MNCPGCGASPDGKHHPACIGGVLANVKRIGPPLSRVTVPCPSCGGDGWQDSGFAFGSNVSFGRVCTHCRGARFVWRNVPPKVYA